MEGSKKWYQSKTVWGVIVNTILKAYIVLRMIGKVSGFNLPEIPTGLSEVLVEMLILMSSFIADVIAVIGRLKADKKIE